MHPLAAANVMLLCDVCCLEYRSKLIMFTSCFDRAAVNRSGWQRATVHTTNGKFSPFCQRYRAQLTRCWQTCCGLDALGSPPVFICSRFNTCFESTASPHRLGPYSRLGYHRICRWGILLPFSGCGVQCGTRRLTTQLQGVLAR